MIFLKELRVKIVELGVFISRISLFLMRRVIFFLVFCIVILLVVLMVKYSFFSFFLGFLLGGK